MKNSIIKSQLSGFSLIEMIVVMAVMAVLLAIAIPTYISVVPAVDLKADGRKIMFAMQRARQVASSYNRPTRVLIDCTAETLAFEGKKNPCRLAVEIAVFDDTGKALRWVPVQAGKLDLSPATVVSYRTPYTQQRDHFTFYQNFFNKFYSVNGLGPRTYGVANKDSFAGDSAVVVYTPSGEAVTYCKLQLLLKSSRKDLPGWELDVINSTGNVRLKEVSA
ncbi:MAG: prepilin-type N-terminal cleavage/methylation domain-containing protein [Deltaproteobacteria bacterium]|jgi:prepilin-type N-terminal cleavage/methylation domain-containing protein|nr:prepilin-type N-terminal cleavage/methylation domain-containing protein [Deltaproteobacteria bacterium]